MSSRPQTLRVTTNFAPRRARLSGEAGLKLRVLIDVCMYMYACMYCYMSVCMYVCIRTYIHTHIHTYIHTCIYVYMDWECFGLLRLCTCLRGFGFRIFVGSLFRNIGQRVLRFQTAFPCRCGSAEASQGVRVTFLEFGLGLILRVSRSQNRLAFPNRRTLYP